MMKEIDKLIQFIKSGDRSKIYVNDIVSDSTLYVDIRRYIMEYQQFKSIEENIRILSNELMSITENRSSKESQLDSLIRTRTAFIHGVYGLLRDIYNKSRFDRTHLEQLFYDMVKTDFSDLIKYLDDYLNETTDLSVENGLVKNAIQFSLKAHVSILKNTSIIDSNLDSAIFLLSKGSISAQESKNNKFIIKYEYDFADFFFSNSQLEDSAEKYRKTLSSIEKYRLYDYRKMGECYRQLLEIDNRLNFKVNAEYLQKSEENFRLLRESNESKVLISYLYNDAGLCYKRINDLNDAHMYYTKAIKIKEALLSSDTTVNSNDYNIGSTYNNLSLVYKAEGQLELALETVEQAVIKYGGHENSDQPFELANALNNKATILTNLKQLDEAVETLYLVKKIRQSNLDEKSNQNIEKLANVSHNLAALLKIKRKLLKAQQEIDNALRYYLFLYNRSSIQYSYLYANCLITSASINKEMNNYKLAIKQLLRAEDVAISSYVGVHKNKILGRIYNNLANTYRRNMDRDLSIKYIDLSIETLADQGEKSYEINLHHKALTNGIEIAKFFSDIDKLDGYLNQINQLNAANNA